MATNSYELVEQLELCKPRYGDITHTPCVFGCREVILELHDLSVEIWEQEAHPVVIVEDRPQGALQELVELPHGASVWDIITEVDRLLDERLGPSKTERGIA